MDWFNKLSPKKRYRMAQIARKRALATMEEAQKARDLAIWMVGESARWDREEEERVKAHLAANPPKDTGEWGWVVLCFISFVCGVVIGIFVGLLCSRSLA